MLVLLALGSTCVFYGYSCISAEFRANGTDYCKNIHNDDSAMILAGFGLLFLAPWLIAVLAAIAAPFYFLRKMIQGWAVKCFGTYCTLDMNDCRIMLFKLMVLLFLLEVLAFICLIYLRYCGNAEHRANHNDICKGIHNDDSARALQASGWIFFIFPMIVSITTVFAVFMKRFSSS